MQRLTDWSLSRSVCSQRSLWRESVAASWQTKENRARSLVDSLMVRTGSSNSAVTETGQLRTDPAFAREAWFVLARSQSSSSSRTGAHPGSANSVFSRFAGLELSSLANPRCAMARHAAWSNEDCCADGRHKRWRDIGSKKSWAITGIRYEFVITKFLALHNIYPGLAASLSVRGYSNNQLRLTVHDSLILFLLCLPSSRSGGFASCFLHGCRRIDRLPGFGGLRW